MIEMTIQLHEAAATQLAPLRNRLDEIIEAGLRHVDRVDTGLNDEVMRFLSDGSSAAGECKLMMYNALCS